MVAHPAVLACYNSICALLGYSLRISLYADHEMENGA